MLQFLQSIWLWAAAGVIVPIIIHLWNVKQGKTLQVGSIVFLSESAKSHAKSFKLSDLLILSLRCLLIIVLAMLVAKPFVEKEYKLQEEKGWILIEKNKIREVYKQFKTRIDSLTKRGYTFHYFQPDFAVAKLDDVLKLQQDSTQIVETSYWTLLKVLDQKVPAKLPIQLFTDNSLRHFTDSRPALALNLKWNIYASSDTSRCWIQKAYKTSNDNIGLNVGQSSAMGIAFTSQNISITKANAKFNLRRGSGNLFVNFSDSAKAVSNKPVQVDTSTLTIAIYTDKFQQDANYLRAAITAIRDFTKYKIRLTVLNDVKEIPGNLDWLFWLSEDRLPLSLRKNNVFLYEKGELDNVHSHIITEDLAVATANENIALRKSIRHASDNLLQYDEVWKNGFGESILKVEAGKSTIYHFYSRFNPQWNDLSWSGQFPQVIFRLLFGGNTNSTEWSENDKRIIDASQIQPAVSGEKNVAKQAMVYKKDISNILWIIAFALFLIERMLSSKNKREELHG